MACGTGTTFLVLILLDRQQNKKKKKKRILKMGFSPPQASTCLYIVSSSCSGWNHFYFLYFSPRHPSQHYKLMSHPPFVLIPFPSGVDYKYRRDSTERETSAL
jgi:hypothetical protein